MSSSTPNPLTALSMSSLEIAELVESRHDKVRQSIERLAARGVIAQPPVRDGVKSLNGVVEKVYVFSGEQGRRDSIIVVAQLSPEYTAVIVDRWQELEKQINEVSPALEFPCNYQVPTEYELILQLDEQKTQVEDRMSANISQLISQAAITAELIRQINVRDAEYRKQQSIQFRALANGLIRLAKENKLHSERIDGLEDRLDLVTIPQTHANLKNYIASYGSDMSYHSMIMLERKAKKETRRMGLDFFYRYIDRNGRSTRELCFHKDVLEKLITPVNIWE
jgi:phage regulator Rha-like protein